MCIKTLHRDLGRKWASLETQQSRAGGINLEITDTMYLKPWAMMRVPRIVSQTAFLDL